MYDHKKMNDQIKRLMEMLDLTLNPQAIKMVEDVKDVPADALWPRRDKGQHMALCQAIALTKRQGRTVFMTKEDHWCWNPIIGLGHVKCEPGMDSFEEVSRNLGIADPDAAREFFANFPKLEYGKYAGMLMAPAQSATFEPDVILVNCNNNFQLRSMIWAIKSQTGKMLESSFDAIDSCIHSIVTPMKDGQYRITLPDPGDQERALSDRHEIILTVPTARLDELMTGMEMLENMGVNYHGMKTEMKYDFARPPFYNTLYKIWGLDQGEDWEH